MATKTPILRVAAPLKHRVIVQGRRPGVPLQGLEPSEHVLGHYPTAPAL